MCRSPLFRTMKGCNYTPADQVTYQRPSCIFYQLATKGQATNPAKKGLACGLTWLFLTTSINAAAKDVCGPVYLIYLFLVKLGPCDDMLKQTSGQIYTVEF